MISNISLRKLFKFGSDVLFVHVLLESSHGISLVLTLGVKILDDVPHLAHNKSEDKPSKDHKYENKQYFLYGNRTYVSIANCCYSGNRPVKTPEVELSEPNIMKLV